jgi:polar amino acid transport system substrate-binding protein
MILPSRFATAALLLLLSVTGAFAQTQAAPVTSGVRVPNFWDPRARLERPPAAEIGTIRFLTTGDFPPFSFRDRRGILIGFDVDLANAICSVLEVQCAIQTRPFDTLIAGLKDGTGNAIIAGFDAERAGAEGLIATHSYLKIPARFITLKEKSFDPAEPPAEGFVGVVCGTAHAAYLAAFFEFRVACYQTPAAALAALRLAFWLHGPGSEDCCRFVGGAYLDDRFFGSGPAILTRPEDQTLKSALDYALREVYRSGSYEELYLRYFPVSLF